MGLGREVHSKERTALPGSMGRKGEVERSAKRGMTTRPRPALDALGALNSERKRPPVALLKGKNWRKGLVKGDLAPTLQRPMQDGEEGHRPW